MMNVIDFFVKTLDGPLYIVSTVICVILIFACIGYLAEKSISEKKEKEKFVSVDEGQGAPNPVEPTSVLPQGVVAFNHAPLNQAPFVPIKNPMNNNMGIPTTVVPQMENSLTPTPSTPSINNPIPSIPEIPTINGIPTAIAPPTPSVNSQVIPTVNTPNVNLTPNSNLSKGVVQPKEEKTTSQVQSVGTPMAPNANLTPNANLSKELVQPKEEKTTSQVQSVGTPMAPNADLAKAPTLTPPPVTTTQEATIVAPQQSKNITIPTANQAPVAPQAPII